MVKEFFISIILFTSASGLTVPQLLQQEQYVVPTYSEVNRLSYKSLRTPTLVAMPQKKDDDTGPRLQSRAALVMDEASGAILWQKNQDTQLPIASITKLVTALVALDYVKDWDGIHAYTAKENALGGQEFSVSVGDEFTVRDILKTALVVSANNSAAALAHSTGLSDEEFKQAMNAKAQQLGMSSSHFVEPTGLSENNISTVRDLAILMRTVSHRPILMEPLGAAEHRMTRRNPNTGNEVMVRTTNRLIKNHDPFVLAGKTGFTYEALNCLVTVATNPSGNHIVVVLLGGPDPTTRFEETQELIQWAYEHYQWE